MLVELSSSKSEGAEGGGCERIAEAERRMRDKVHALPDPQRDVRKRPDRTWRRRWKSQAAAMNPKGCDRWKDQDKCEKPWKTPGGFDDSCWSWAARQVDVCEIFLLERCAVVACAFDSLRGRFRHQECKGLVDRRGDRRVFEDAVRRGA